jgi:hypothetical protein
MLHYIEASPNLRCPEISAQTLPIGSKKDGIGKHKTTRTRGAQFSDNSLKSRMFIGVSREKVNGLGLEPQSDALPS